MEHSKKHLASGSTDAALINSPGLFSDLLSRGNGSKLGILGLLLLLPSFVFATPHLPLVDGEIYLAAESLVEASGEATPAADAVSLEAGGVLDVYSNAFAAYSLRVLSSSYNGPAIRVRRSSDGAEQDIGFKTNGLLNVGALTSFVGSGDGYVTVWYDQSGRGNDLEQPDASMQPLIAYAGDVITDEYGKPRLWFNGDTTTGKVAEMTVPNMSTLLGNHNLAVFVLQEAIAHNEWTSLIGIAEEGQSHRYFDYRLKNLSSSLFIGDGSSSQSTSTTAPGVTHRTLQVINMSEGLARAYRNNILTGSLFHELGEAESMLFRLGNHDTDNPYAGFVSEVLLFPERTEPELENIYLDLNTFYELGGTESSNDTNMPQAWQWQVALYDWLETITLDDVTYTPAEIQWDGYYQDVDQLANLSLALSHRPTVALRSEPKWYVLDDGNGAGIEFGHFVRIPYRDHISSSGAFGNDPAFWYGLDVPLAGGGQGNPYYQNPAVGYRALIIAAVEIMEWSEVLDVNTGNARNDYYGKGLSSWAYIYRQCKDLLDSDTREAFEEGLEHILDGTIDRGAQDVNTNMDMFFVNGAATLYASTNNERVRTKALMAAKKVLLGYTDGELETRHDVLGGTFFPAGYIGEADGPETTYNGHSFAQLVSGLVYVADLPEWEFLKDIVDRMAAFKLYQHFRDPAREGGSKFFWTGPSGYANRTGGSYVRDQGGVPGRDYAAAALVPSGPPLLRSYKFDSDSDLPTVAELIGGIDRQVDRINGAGFDELVPDTPPIFNPYSSWPPEIPIIVPEWYSTLTNLVTHSEASTYAPVIRPAYYYNKAFGGAPTGDEFWAYKGSDGAQDFAFFVEADAQQGPYKGWYGGKLEAFWTEQTGLLIVNTHDKAGCGSSQENTTCWDEVDLWAAHHVWGRDENGGGFATADIRSRAGSRTSTFDLDGATPYVEVTNHFDDASLSNGGDGQQGGSELQGSMSVTNRFEAISKGIRVRHTVTSDASDQITELWVTLPVNLRYNLSAQGGQESLPDATIEYWNGNNWRPVSTALVSTTALRIGRDYLDGVGPRYGYIDFGNAQSVKLSRQVWEQSYQGSHRIRNILVDLHGNPGSVRAMPADFTLQYSIQTTDPSTSTPGNLNHHINLIGGWNLTSTYISPDEPSMEDIFANTEVVLVKDQAGRAFIPEFGINDIGDWNPLHAYMVYAPAENTLTIEGEAVVPEDTPVSLAADWSFLSYLRDEPLPIEDALQSIVSNITLVTNRAGETYIPDFGINDIGSMNPGEGYKIYMEQSAVLTYPSNTTQAAKGGVAGVNYETHTSVPGIPSSMLVLVEGTSLKEGSEIIAKTSDGEEVGRGSVRQGRATVTVQGDEALTPDIVEGASAGETLVLEVAMRTSEEQHVIGVASLRDALNDQLRSGELQYAEDAFFVAKVEDVPRQFSLAQNYPNPFNPTTTLSYDLPSEALVVLEVYNMLGQRVTVLVDGQQEAGRYQIPFEASDLASGVYFYRLKAGSYQATKKMMLMK